MPYQAYQQVGMSTSSKYAVSIIRIAQQHAGYPLRSLAQPFPRSPPNAKLAHSQYKLNKRYLSSTSTRVSSRFPVDSSSVSSLIALGIHSMVDSLHQLPSIYPFLHSCDLSAYPCLMLSCHARVGFLVIASLEAYALVTCYAGLSLVYSRDVCL